MDQVPVDDQTVKRPAFFRVGIRGVQNGLQEKGGGVSISMFYLLVFYELCNGAAEEVDEQCWENDDNCVNNVCHRENLTKVQRFQFESYSQLLT